ncbi:MAG: aminotransferase class I/II-fold pyridoxal phosphate-dependent enzyme [Saprospiraceae bacterium]|nr:aminotransferase class I/II-fold pyridoxal phosphate-dependent enzyme [Saprospiraceae bacterium]
MKTKSADRISGVKEYYFSRKLREIAQRRQQGEDIINLGIGSPDLPPHPRVIEALCAASQEPGNHGYQSYRGIPELRVAFADFYQRKFGVDLDPATEVLPLLGSKEGIMHISMAYLNPGDQVLVPNPGYPTYSAAARLTGAEMVQYPLSAANGWAPDLGALAEEDLSRVKLMWVNYPHMPSGASGGRTLFDKLTRFAREHQILLCHDNPYSFILNDNPGSMLQPEGSKEVALELISLSKTFNMAGWRIGALVGDAERIQQVLKFKSNMDSGMFRPLQLAAAEALQLGPEWHDELNEKYRQRREIVISLLEGLDCTVARDQVGMFVWARVSEKWANGEALSDALLDQTGVFITPGMIFGSEGDMYVRISLCTDSEMLNKAHQRVLGEIAQQRQVNS